MIPLFIVEFIARVIAYIFLEVLFEGIIAFFSWIFGFERKPEQGDKLEFDVDPLEEESDDEDEDDVRPSD